MNPDTGRIYSGTDEKEARERGEKLMQITEREAALLRRLPSEARPPVLFHIRELPIGMHPLARLPGLSEEDVRALRNAGKRARRARRAR